MEKPYLQAERRTVTGKQVRSLRRQGKLPAILYGHNFECTPISLDLHTASRVLSGVSSSSLITIELEGTPHAALVREKQRDFIRGNLLHVDFQVVSMTEEIRAMVGIELFGTAPAVKEYSGVVVTGLDELEIECLPQYLPEKIRVDLSNLSRIGDGIYVRDIKVGENVRVLNDPNEMIVVVTGSTTEEEVVVEEGAAEPEVIERGKKEEVSE